MLLADVCNDILNKAKQNIQKSIRMIKMMRPECNEANAAELICKITFSTDYSLINKTRLVIENVCVDWNIKQSVYDKLISIKSPFRFTT